MSSAYTVYTILACSFLIMVGVPFKSFNLYKFRSPRAMQSTEQQYNIFNVIMVPDLSIAYKPISKDTRMPAGTTKMKRTCVIFSHHLTYNIAIKVN